MTTKKLVCVTTLTFVAVLAITLPVLGQNEPSHNKAPRYKLMDLGTFGGPVSYVCFSCGGLNQQKSLVTSAADTATLDPNYPNINPIFFGSDPYIVHAFRWEQGLLGDLGVLPGGTSSGGLAINNHGVVAGYSTTGAIDPATGWPVVNAALWRNGEILNLGTFGGTLSVAWFLNNSGQVVGQALNTIPDPFADVIGIGGTTQSHAFLWQDGNLQDLGTLGGPYSEASFMNEHREAAGSSFTNDIPNDTTGVPTLDPFLWTNGRMLDLGTLGGTFGVEHAINNRGQVAGTSNLAGDQTFHPFLWDRGQMRDLGTFGGSNGEATWMNDSGEVVGVADFPGDVLHDAFLWKNGVMTDLGNLGKTSRAHGINSRTQVVGNARMQVGLPHAWLWEKGMIYDLNDLIPPGSGVLLADAPAINDAGAIDAIGLPAGCDDPNACGHAYLLVPCGEGDPGSCRNELIKDGVDYQHATPTTTRQTTWEISDSPVSPTNQLRNRMQRHGIRERTAAPTD